MSIAELSEDENQEILAFDCDDYRAPCPLCDDTGTVIDRNDSKGWFKPCPACGGEK